MVQSKKQGIDMAVFNVVICVLCMCGSRLLVGFVALRPKSTAMVIAGRSVNLTTLFPGQA